MPRAAPVTSATLFVASLIVPPCLSLPKTSSEITLYDIADKFPVFVYKFPVPPQKFPVRLTWEFGFKSAKSLGE